MMRLKLTRRQQQVLNIIQAAVQDQGMPPTRAEIAHQLGFRSANAAEEHLRALERKGRIQILRGTSRGLRILEQSAPPSKKFLQYQDEADSTLFSQAPDYLLRVEGVGMKAVSLLEGDLLAVKRLQPAKDQIPDSTDPAQVEGIVVGLIRKHS